MLVEELVEKLQQLDPKREVVLAKDTEGNSYSPLWEVEGENVAYEAETTYSGRKVLEKLTDELAARGWSEEDVASGDGAIPAVILWPTN